MIIIFCTAVTQSGCPSTQVHGDPHHDTGETIVVRSMRERFGCPNTRNLQTNPRYSTDFLDFSLQKRVLWGPVQTHENLEEFYVLKYRNITCIRTTRPGNSLQILLPLQYGLSRKVRRSGDIRGRRGTGACGDGARVDMLREARLRLRGVG